MKTYSAGLGIAMIILAVFIGLTISQKSSYADNDMGESSEMKYNELTPEEARVIVHKGTERPGSGKYEHFKDNGTFICKQCNAPLYHSTDKFDSGCGWPSFDDEIPGAVRHTLDADGHRTEITCTNCGGHLGHVFEGEHFTDKNVRHCVNSISLSFVPKDEELPPVITESKVETAYFAGGCFWGVEYLLEQLDGVIDARSGFMGGHVENPTYYQVCHENTGHAEAVEVKFDPAKISFEELAKYFFEIHDPGQENRQGPDIGPQYRSAVFYTSAEQKFTADRLIDVLKEKGYKVVTEVEKAGEFYAAEDYHQDYYEGNGKTPYCHVHEKKF